MKRAVVLVVLASACSEPFDGERAVASTDAGADAGDAAEPDAADATACEPETLNDLCECPAGYYLSAIEHGASCTYRVSCTRRCPGATFTMCSLSAPCPSGWTQTGTTFTEPCSGLGLTRASGHNAIECSP